MLPYHRSHRKLDLWRSPRQKAAIVHPLRLDEFELPTEVRSYEREHQSTVHAIVARVRAVLAGGYYAKDAATHTEIFDPASGTSVEGPLMWDYHISGTATKLLNGEVLILGGSIGNQASATAELFR